jgi:undecaprenyl-diphosphatase
MNVLHALLLGIVEGITEFLPVSSTGHLVLIERLVRLEATPFLTSFTIAIQLGAVLAVLFIYGRMLWETPRLVARIGVALVPTGLAGFLLYPLVRQWLSSEGIVIVALILGGIAMIVLERWVFPHRELGAMDETVLPYRSAFLIGLFQCLALVPGVSRSAATIIGGLLGGLSRTAAVRFSFLLALPTMVAATGLDLYKNADAFTGQDLGLLAVGTVASFLTAAVAMRWLLRYIRNHGLTAFGIYRIGFAVLVWLLLR